MEDRFKFRAYYIEEKVMRDFINLTNLENLVVAKGVCSIMQCTGLKDKNGKLIYEGDVVKGAEMTCGVQCEDVCVVEWDAEITGFKPLNIYDCDCCIYNESDYMEIIGNIHENPELLTIIS
jgi:uncharacterized phage protein (TIGR01671 family)